MTEPHVEDREDVRLAVVMNGGVSLAVWISGVTLELLHAVQASRDTEQGGAYRGILDLLHATARIDVIVGTSAGGLNGAFLALGLVNGRDLENLRDLWREHGDLAALLRDPLAKDPPSLLRGDDYFLPEVRSALGKVLEQPRLGSPREPVELLLTGTLWDGRVSSFTDDMGVAITEVDYDATFRFSTDPVPGSTTTADGDLTRPDVVPLLARAARCTSSFPAAFEPGWVTVSQNGGQGPDNRSPSDAGRVNFTTSQYVVDGGVLLNKPLRPALEAIYRQPADVQVRRVLAYVVPDPGEQASEAATVSDQAPSAARVVLDVFTRLRSTASVARELSEIRTRNEETAARRRARGRFAAAMTGQAESLSASAWSGYQEVRREQAARTIGRLIAAGQQRDTVGGGRWSEQELVETLRGQPMSFVPGGDLATAVTRSGDDWDWGQTTVHRLGEMTVDVLKRAVWLAPIGSPARSSLVERRRAVHGTLETIREDRAALDAFWLTRAGSEPRIPKRLGSATAPAGNREALDDWLTTVLGEWDAVPGRRSGLHDRALALARHLRFATATIRQVLGGDDRPWDGDGVERDQLAALHTYLLAGDPDDAGVLRRMLRLDVVQLAFGDAAPHVEQQVELVQVSSLAPDRLTGIQEHHFGAFYRPSWRVNDWLHGRLDGADHLVRILLSPERIRQLGEATDPFLARLRTIAIGDGPDRDALEVRWNESELQCRAELDRVLSAEPLPGALPACAERIAYRIRTEILRDDLPALARAVRGERDHPEAGVRWLKEFDTVWRREDDPPSLPTLWALWEQAKRIGGQRIRDEVGGDTFARTVSHATAVATGLLGRPAKPRTVATVFRAFRGYALMVWAMVGFLSGESRFGKRAVEIALAAGGVLVAVTILVPGIPLGLTLLGVLLLLAGLTTAALLAGIGERTPGAQRRSPTVRVGWRLLWLTVLVAGALAAHLWWDLPRNGGDGTAWRLLAKVVVALLVVLAGLWVARPAGGYERSRATTEPQPAPAGGSTAGGKDAGDAARWRRWSRRREQHARVTRR